MTAASCQRKLLILPFIPQDVGPRNSKSGPVLCIRWDVKGEERENTSK